MNASQLKGIVTKIFEENKNRSPKGLQSDRGVQNRFMKSYKTRYFLELIQNARDAIVWAGQSEGKIRAWFDGECFYFANNGAPFNMDGVESICYPAISTKDEKEMVGHKGIGFNAILEITDCPAIITQAGTFRFSTVDTSQLLGEISPDHLPLFQFPLYEEDTVASLFPELDADGYTTVIKIPLNKQTDAALALKKALDISGQDIIFLSAIHQLEIGGQEKRISVHLPFVKLEDQGQSVLFRQFEHQFELMPEQIEKFDEDEQEQFQKSNLAECKFLLRCGDDGKFIPDRSAKLYLFYAMQVETGFPFSIHSFFSVSIDRKNLTEESKLNGELFTHIANYLTGEFLEEIKVAFKDQVLDILAFQPHTNGNLEPFYKAVKQALKDKAFIYHPIADRFLKPGEVLLMDHNESKLFDDGQLGDKYLLYNYDYRVTTFLTGQCEVKRLDKYFVQANIESKCEQRKNDPDFFTRLYSQNTYWECGLSNKKILLTQHGQLVSGDLANVYYQRKAGLNTPIALESRLAFLHPVIKVADIRESSAKLLGLKEYNEDQLIAAAIGVFSDDFSEDSPTIALDILRFLKRLDDISFDNIQKITRSVKLPVVHKKSGLKKWLNTLHDPIYLENFMCAEAYLDDYFYVDVSLLSGISEETGWMEFLQRIGVWNKPAMYIKNGRSQSLLDEEKTVDNDRLFHVPTGAVGITFTQNLISNWATYHSFITSYNGSNLSFKVLSAAYTSDAEKIKYAGAIFQLRNVAWLCLPDYEKLLRPQDLIAIAETDYHKVANQILLEYLNLIRLDFVLDKEFINDLGIIHLSDNSIDNYKNLLDIVAQKFEAVVPPKERSAFEKFYNRILTYLHDFLNIINGRDNEINQLMDSTFLCRSLIDHSLAWAKGRDIINVDQKAFLDQLTASGLLEKIRHPYCFTKKDRKEWGKYGQRIGRPISKLVETKIISEGEFCEITTVLKHPEVIVAFVELGQASNFSPETLEMLRGKMISRHASLKVEMDIEGQKFTLNRKHFTTGEKDKTVLHIDASLLIRYRDLNYALSEFFEDFADTDINFLDLIIGDIQDLLSKEKKYKYAIDRDIDPSRLAEIALVFDQGVATVQEPIILKPDDKPIQVSGLNVTVEIQTVSETTEVKDVAIHGNLRERLAAIDELITHPVVAFDGDAATLPSTPVYTGNAIAYGNGAGGGGARTTLSNPTKRNIGFLGEYYVYKLLVERRQSLLVLLGLQDGTAFKIDWYNEHRLENENASDGSIGRGCDIEISDRLAIEVKTMIGTSDIVTLTSNELTYMRLKREDYFLIILKNLLDTDKFFTTVVKNPYQHILDGTLNFVEAQINAPSTKSDKIYSMNVIPELDAIENTSIN